MSDNWATIKGNRVNLNDEYNINDAVEEYYSKGRFKTLYLPTEGYAHVQSEINTWYYDRFVGKKSCTIEVDDYIYAFKNAGFGRCRIVGKFSIENSWAEFADMILNDKEVKK